MPAIHSRLHPARPPGLLPDAAPPAGLMCWRACVPAAPCSSTLPGRLLRRWRRPCRPRQRRAWLPCAPRYRGPASGAPAWRRPRHGCHMCTRPRSHVRCVPCSDATPQADRLARQLTTKLPPVRRPLPAVQLYCLDAGAVAAEAGLGRRVNMVMQAAFFALSGVMDINEVRRFAARACLIAHMCMALLPSCRDVPPPRAAPVLRHHTTECGSKRGRWVAASSVGPQSARRRGARPCEAFSQRGAWPLPCPRCASSGCCKSEHHGVLTHVPHSEASPCLHWHVLQAIPLLKESIKKAYGKKGEKASRPCATGRLRDFRPSVTPHLPICLALHRPVCTAA